MTEKRFRERVIDFTGWKILERNTNYGVRIRSEIRLGIENGSLHGARESLREFSW